MKLTAQAQNHPRRRETICAGAKLSAQAQNYRRRRETIREGAKQSEQAQNYPRSRETIRAGADCAAGTKLVEQARKVTCRHKAMRIISEIIR